MSKATEKLGVDELFAGHLLVRTSSHRERR